MNKLISTLTLIVFSICAKAQTDKGNVYIGGSVSYNRNTADQSGYSNEHEQAYLTPTVGFFLAKNFSIGLSPQYSYSKNISAVFLNSGLNVNKNESHLLGGGINLRYYIAIVPRLFFFPEFSSSYMVSIGKSSTESKLSRTSISPNLTFFATKKLALNLTYGAWAYTYQTNKGNFTNDKFTNFDFNINSSVALGVNYFFN
jgi:hypothetical protein